ncbi:prolyl oligopeptidase family serine peptidase [Shimwellia blattae]|uniref:Protease II n=1 Tax=Shimwellia blattae (strain ATCC 29907 / DSM 4481 / JCM 1650 / NBRC 105725 / CDC 9005-74) TaxID=630626 RepID=I2BA43_SHIBC|nr:prolyl oligopeptidase family serine peptidase [Shimwellia blattae]AFJ47397.1 protease II [Shimwellia blattae DSM 4481 = NBRC 105725]GAB80411.1 protease II [Shimwellia blattae DSM 4481 = NBRC 105725]
MPPKAKKIPHAMTLHGETRIDNYYWLRDDTRTDPQILSYLEQENQYGRQIMASQNDLRDTLLGEILQRIPQRDASAPWEKNGYRYRHIYESGGEYPVYQRQPVATCTPDAWDILLDGNQRAAGSEFWDMGGMSVSTDNRIMAVAEDYLSRRQYGLRFKDLESGNWYPETLENVSASFVWANDGATLYYIRKHPQTLLPYQVWRHRVGSPGREDTLIYEERDERYYVSLSKSTSRKYVLIYLSSTSTSEILLLDADDQQAEPVSFLPRRHDHEYSIDHYQHWFYIRSNREGKNFALYRSRVAEESAWKTLIAHRQDVMLESFTLFSRWLVLEEREQGLTQLRLIHRQTRAESRIAFDDPAYVTWVATNPEPDTPWLRYGYSSMTAADTLYALNMDTGERVVLKQQEVPGYQACDYRSERLWVRAEDGAQIPVSVVYHRRHFRKGANPLLVYGYGAYGSSIDADFSPSRLSLLDRGFVVAIAHIRGGGELGQQWYEEGKLDHKMNTFTDYLQVCDALLAQGYGDPGYLYGMGGSAGGLLMGAVVNMRPTLFRGIVAQVPFVDVLTTMLDESIPLTTGEYEEWGNPNEPRWYHYIRQYSPYDNLTPQEYPHMLVTTGLHDSQVQYWEPAKWVAKLREIKQGDNLLLLCTDMDTGHGGKSGRFKSWEGVALEYTFLVALTQGTLPGHDD